MKYIIFICWPRSYYGGFGRTPCTLPASFARCCMFLELRRLRSFAPSPMRESRDEDHPGEGRERELSRH